jgi:hypothetical protein
MACELTARDADARPVRSGPGLGTKWLRLSLFNCAVGLVRGAHGCAWPQADQLTTAITRLQALAPAEQPRPSLRHERTETPGLMKPHPHATGQPHTTEN